MKNWLTELGLGKYVSVFAEQEVDRSVIADLTESDLEKIGLPLGPRKKILKAIAAEQSVVETSAAGTPLSLPFQGDHAERRHLTILFSDLVGSTELSQRLDPEDLRFVLRAYQDVCHAAIGRYDGFVARYMGDGVMAYFGYPRAHEDEPERAIRSALELIEGMRTLNSRLTVHHPSVLQVRVGIATGLVVVGDIIGEGTALESAVVGDAPNLAARLQSLAEPNTIVVSNGTYELAANQFEFLDLGAQELKGINGKPNAWQVVSSVAVETRFDAVHTNQLTGHVGRLDEITTLMQRWQEACSGTGRAVMLSGEAGIGKSRTTKTLYESISSQDPIRLRFQCSPHHINGTLYPLIQQLERQFGFSEADDVERKIAKMQNVLRKSVGYDDGKMSLYKALLSLYVENESPIDLNIDELFAALIENIESLSQRQPLLLVFEDLHWIDPTTLDFLDALIMQLPRMRALVVATHRPEFTATWNDAAQVSTLHLGRLNRDEVYALINNVAGNSELPESIYEQIVDKTDGVPLFVEELTKTIIESKAYSGIVGEGEQSAIAQGFAIPATLQDSLMMRLDRLNAVKDVAQIASVIGREFTSELLIALCPDEMMPLDAALAALVDAQLLSMHRNPDGFTYVFKHALVQDAAYESLLKHRRLIIHQKIAETLIGKFPGITESQPELIAFHFTRSDDYSNAVFYWNRAGARAMQRSSYVEAASHYEKALELLGFLTSDEDRDRQELELLTALATALLPTRGYGSIEVKQAYARARKLCEVLGETDRIISILFGEWASAVHRDHLEEVLSFSRTTFSMTEQSSNMGTVLMGNRTLGNSLLFTGRLQEAHKHLQFTSDHYVSQRDSFLAFEYGLDIKTASQSQLLVTEWLLGNPNKALAIAHETLVYCQELDHGNSTAHALIHAGGFLPQFLNKVDDLHQHMMNLIELAEAGGYTMFLAWARIFLGWAQSERQQENGLSLMENGLKDAHDSGSDLYQAYFLTLLAQGYLNCGQTQKALDTINKASSQMNERGESWYAAEVLRVQGVLQHRLHPNDENAEVLLIRALDVARKQSAKVFELRASVSLAELWRECGKEEAGRKLVETSCVGLDDSLLTGELDAVRAYLAP